jgi:hypothetical protein
MSPQIPKAAQTFRFEQKQAVVLEAGHRLLNESLKR